MKCITNCVCRKSERMSERVGVGKRNEDEEWVESTGETGNRKRNDRNVCNVINRTYWNSNKILQNEFLLLENRVASNSFIIVRCILASKRKQKNKNNNTE